MVRVMDQLFHFICRGNVDVQVSITLGDIGSETIQKDIGTTRAGSSERVARSLGWAGTRGKVARNQVFRMVFNAEQGTCITAG